VVIAKNATHTFKHRGRKPFGGSPCDTVNKYDTIKGKQNMKQTYIVEFNPTHLQNDWSRIEFTSITKALGFISLMVKRGCHCQIFPAYNKGAANV
jgi:hypothetical protein